MNFIKHYKNVKIKCGHFLVIVFRLTLWRCLYCLIWIFQHVSDACNHLLLSCVSQRGFAWYYLLKSSSTLGSSNVIILSYIIWSFIWCVIFMSFVWYVLCLTRNLSFVMLLHLVDLSMQHSLFSMFSNILSI